MDGRLIAPTVALVMSLAACTAADGSSPAGSRADAPAPASPAEVLILGSADGWIVLEPNSGDPLDDRPAGLVSPDGAHLYATSHDAGMTTLVSRDSATGVTTSRARVRGILDARVASVSGRAVALMAPLPNGVHPWTPVPRARTRIVVVDPSGETNERRFDLEGNFEPEAFSVDDTELFLIQHLPAEAPTVYRVTVLDLASGEVRPIRGRFKTPPERMPGVRLQQVFDPVTDQLYTLYANEPSRSYDGSWEGSAYGAGEGSAYGAGDGGGEVTFVHVLNLRGGWAFCAGVPRDLWGQPARAQALATSPDGELLYIVDSMRGIVSEMDTRSLEIVRTSRVALGSAAGERTSAVTSPDGARLFVSSASDGRAVFAIDTANLELVDRWVLDGSVLDLGPSADGARLYAALKDGIVQLDPVTGANIGTIPAAGVEEILHVQAAARGS